MKAPTRSADFPDGTRAWHWNDGLRNQGILDTAVPREPDEDDIEAGQVEQWLQARYSAGDSVNHDYGHDAHVASLATPGIAPGPPIAPKRGVLPRLVEWSIAALVACIILAALYVAVHGIQAI